MMTSSNGSIFSVTGPLWGESIGHRWIPLTKASDAELWRFLWSAPGQTAEQNQSRRRWFKMTPYYFDSTVMLRLGLTCWDQRGSSWWLLLVRPQGMSWNIADLPVLSIEPTGRNLSEIWIKHKQISSRNMQLEMPFAKCRHFCHCLNESTLVINAVL